MVSFLQSCSHIPWPESRHVKVHETGRTRTLVGQVREPVEIFENSLVGFFIGFFVMEIGKIFGKGWRNVLLIEVIVQTLLRIIVSVLHEELFMGKGFLVGFLRFQKLLHITYGANTFPILHF